MSRFTLDERVRLSIELALTANDADPLRLQQQDTEARRLHMSGAEIDAARRGWSFDVHTSIALALALGASSGQDVGTQRDRALRAGIGEAICDQIEKFAVTPREKVHD